MPKVSYGMSPNHPSTFRPRQQCSLERPLGYYVPQTCCTTRKRFHLRTSPQQSPIHVRNARQAPNYYPNVYDEGATNQRTATNSTELQHLDVLLKQNSTVKDATSKNTILLEAYHTVAIRLWEACAIKSCGRQQARPLPVCYSREILEATGTADCIF